MRWLQRATRIRARFGNLRRLTPFSRNWGQDRGRPVDRYYIESFLSDHQHDVRGHVLEIGDDAYTRKFGRDQVTRSDVLHVEPGYPGATIIADLTSAENIEDETFDCIILTQTLQLIYDIPAAIRTLKRIVRPGGVVLATVPGITHSGDVNWHKSWFWSMTPASAQRLFESEFGPEHVSVRSHGNVLAAMAFLYGLADHELTRAELNYADPAYIVTIGVRAEKPVVGK